MTKKYMRIVPTALFLVAESTLYYFLLTTGGDTQKWCMYSSIVLCFLFSLFHIKNGNPFLLGGLAFTVCADYCLVICNPIEQLWGMVFFLGAQTLYAVKLHSSGKNKPLLFIRIGLTVIAEIITVVVLKDKTDPLALVSLAYYANLIMNAIQAFTQFRKNKLLPIGFVLFILCDTVIGLQVASGGYLPIAEGSWLYELIFPSYPLSWVFYLPSQVLIALRCAGERKK